MSRSKNTRQHRCHLQALLVAGFVTAAVSPLATGSSIAASPRATAAAGCTYVNLTLHSLTYYRAHSKTKSTALRAYDRQSSRASAAVLCLTNNERTSRNLPALAVNGSLRSAAAAHAVAAGTQRWWFGGANPHVNPKTGSTPESRVKAAGYCPAPISWSFSENTYWGAGAVSTPAAAVRWWMNSPGHRANLLDPAKHEIGIGFVAKGAAPGAPKERAGTYVQDFGVCT
jgi:uncharacterized protein YkwD